MATETIILIGVGIYLLAMLSIGIFAARRTSTEEDFIVAGRRMPLWICVGTIIATWFGGGSMLGASGTGYEGGFLTSIADPFGAALVMFLLGFFFVRTFRRMKLLTVVEFFEQRFGPVAGVVASIGIISSNIGWTGGMMVGFGYMFEVLTGMPMELGIVAGGLIVLVYTVMGGIWAVALTDMVQVIIIATGLIVLLVVVVVDMGGWSAIVAQLPEHSFRMVPLEHTAENWLRYLRLWLIFGLADLCSQTLMQRVFAAKSEQVAQNAFYFAGTGYLLLGLVPVSLGMIAAISLPGLEDPETAIPMLAIEYLHPVAIAVLVGALLAAIMSSADSALLAAASIVGINLAPYFKRNLTEAQKLKVTRVAIFVCGIFAVYVALKVQVVLELIFDANSIMLVAIIMPFIAGVWWKKTNRYGAYSAMVAGCLTFLVVGWIYPSVEGDVIGFAASLITLLVVSVLTQKLDPPRILLDSEGQPISMTNRLGTLAVFKKASERR